MFPGVPLGQVPETVLRLCEIDNIVGIKEATGDLEEPGRLSSSALKILQFTPAMTPLPAS